MLYSSFFIYKHLNVDARDLLYMLWGRIKCIKWNAKSWLCNQIELLITIPLYARVIDKHRMATGLLTER